MTDYTTLCGYDKDTLTVLVRTHEATISRLRSREEAAMGVVQALRFYADPDTWEDHGYENGLHWVAQHAIYEDGGKVAREAIAAFDAGGQ